MSVEVIMFEPAIGIAIITHEARQHLPRCLPPLIASDLRPRVLVVNSSSRDGTVELAEAMGAETLVVPRNEFNHGATRELARRYLGTEIVIMMTPDAHATDTQLVERLTRPIREGKASIAYARQLPREGAGILEAFGRSFNYPARSNLRGIEDWSRWGSYTHFCSNACAAWSSSALDTIGGFPTTLVTEETLAVCRLLGRGHRIAYVADAAVHHSHSYGLIQEFRRHYDIGYVRRRFSDLLTARESDEVRGRRYVRELFGQVMREQPALLPYAIMQTAAKWAGYRCGMLGTQLPTIVSELLSGQEFFWHSKPFERLSGSAWAQH